MKYLLAILTLIALSGCSGKQMKKFGGNLATNNASGHPIGVAFGVVTGGTIYGIGSLLDDEKEKKEEIQVIQGEDLEVKFDD